MIVVEVFTIMNYVIHMDTPQRHPDYRDLLRQKVEAHGGQNACSKATGIPQPTLSRKFTHKRGDFNVSDLHKILRWLNTTESDFWADYEEQPQAKASA